MKRGGRGVCAGSTGMRWREEGECLLSWALLSLLGLPRPGRVEVTAASEHAQGDLGLGGWTPREEALLGARQLPGRGQETALAEARG